MKWGAFAVPVMESVAGTSSHLQKQFERILDAGTVPSTNPNIWSKAQRMVRQIFTATSPFMKHFLVVLRSAAQIPVLNPYGLIAQGLLLFITIADREVDRQAQVLKKMDYICRQLGQLNITRDLPETDVLPEQLINRATDVLSATMTYLAVHIQREPGCFGVLGNLRKCCDLISLP